MTKATLIFHNRRLVYISPEALAFFGGNTFTLKEKSFYEVFSTGCSFLDKIAENKKTNVTLKTLEGCIVDTVITKSTIASDEIVCVYFRVDLSEIAYKRTYDDKGIYQETVEKNMYELLNEITSLRTTRNTAAISKIKRKLIAFSLDVYDILKAKITNNLTTFDVAYAYTDVTEFIKECVKELKEENPDLTIALTPPVMTVFGVNTNKKYLKEFLKNAAYYIAKNSDDKKVYFEVFQQKDSLSLTILGTTLYLDFLTASNRNIATNIEEFSDILILNDLAEKSGAAFSCTQEENTIDSLRITFQRQERRRFIEE